MSYWKGKDARRSRPREWESVIGPRCQVKWRSCPELDRHVLQCTLTLGHTGSHPGIPVTGQRLTKKWIYARKRS